MPALLTSVDAADTAPAVAESYSLKCHVTALTDDLRDEWDCYVLAHPEGTFFHTLAWRDAVAEAFGHKARYWTAVRGGNVVGVLPTFIVASRFAGRLLVSVPYGVGGGILADDEEAAAGLFAAAKSAATEYGCSMIDLRSERATALGLPIVDRYVGFTRELPESVDDVPAWLPRKARAAARNAREKYRLTASFGDEQLAEVWRLYSINMRRLASLAYPLTFFEKLIEHTPGRHWVSLVRWNGRPVAGLVTFLFQDRVMPYFVGSAAEAKRCSAANYLYFTVMERAVVLGFRVFDFGRSRRDNVGSYDFKRFHGFEPRPLGYQRLILNGHAPPDLSPINPAFSLARRMWPHLPLSFTRVVSARLAKHIPG